MATLKRDYGFFVMPDEVMDNKKWSPKARFVYAVLARHADAGGKSFPSYKRIQEMTGFGKTTVSNAIKELEENGWLSHERTGRSNVYTLMSLRKTSDVPPANNRSPVEVQEGLSIEGIHNEGLDADTSVGKEAKQCLDYFHAAYLEETGDKPTICGAKEIKLLKILLRNFDVSAIQEVMDAFFAWDRADYTFGRFFNRFDVVRLKLKEKNQGRR